jgi:hypothetical protein
MVRAMLLSSILVGNVAAIQPRVSLAASLSAPSRAVIGETLAQMVRSDRCRAWHRDCALRWGWKGSPGFHRCLARHNCR